MSGLRFFAFLFPSVTFFTATYCDLQGPGIWKENEGEMPTIKFEEISSDILEKTLQYFHYKMQYDNTPPPFPPFKIDVDQIVPLLKAANFLDT